VKIGSLFSGVGGLELGLEAAIPGARTVWQVEQAAYTRSVLAKHWPNARRYRYVQTVAAHPDQLEPVDIICGGFPCTDISVAGKGAGLDGKSSSLWWPMLRIIHHVRPSFVVVENVSALRRRGLREVLGGLAVCGYDAEWSLLSASDVGAPHLRKRLFIIAWLPDAIGDKLREQPERQQWSDGAAVAPHHGAAECVADSHGGRREELRLAQPAREQGACRGVVDGRGEEWRLDDAAAVGDPDTSRLEGRRKGCQLGCSPDGGQASGADARSAEPRVGRAPHGLSAWTYRGTDPEAWERGVARTVEPRSVPHRAARLRALGNAVVPQCAFEVGRRIISCL